VVPICTSQMATTHAPVSGRAHARFLLGSRSHGVSGAFIPPLTIVQQLKQCLAARALVRKTKRIETRPHSSTVFLLCTSSEKCQTGRAWGSSEAWQPASDHQPVLHVQLLASCFTALLEMVPPPPRVPFRPPCPFLVTRFLHAPPCHPVCSETASSIQ